MAIQYPNFMADPNSVPKKDPLGNFARGYQIAMAPKQMRLDMQNKQAQLEQTQLQNQYYPKIQDLALQKGAMENEWYPKIQQAGLNQQQASTNFLNTENQWYPKTAQANINQSNAATNASNQNTRNAQLESQRQQAFYDMLAGGGTSQPQPAPSQPAQGDSVSMPAPNRQYQPGRGGAPYAPQQASMGAPQQQPTPQPQQDAPQQQGQVINEGNRNLYNIDALYDKNPQYEAMFKKNGLTKTTKNVTNPTTGQLITITTYPSGKQVATSAQVGSSTEDNAFNKQMGTDRAKAYTKYTDAMSSNVKIKNDIESLKSIAENPDFLNAVGPVNSYLAKTMGHSKAAALTGQINAITGNMQAEVANTLGSQAPRARIQMAKLLKPDASDTADVYAGKLAANDVLTKWMSDYNSYMAQSVRTGKPEDEAVKQAAKDLNWDKYQSDIEKRVDTGKLASKLRSSGMPIQYQDSVPYVRVPSTSGDIYIPVSNYNSYIQEYQQQGAVK